MMDDFTFRVLAKSWPQIFMASPNGPPHSNQSAAAVAKPADTVSRPVANWYKPPVEIALTKADIDNIDRIVNETIREAADFEQRRAKNDAAAVAKVVNEVMAANSPKRPVPVVSGPDDKYRMEYFTNPHFASLGLSVEDYVKSRRLDDGLDLLQSADESSQPVDSLPPHCRGNVEFGVGSDRF